MSTVAASSLNAASIPKTPRVRLDYLDGLRGLAALYAVFNHTSFRLVFEERFMPAHSRAMEQRLTATEPFLEASARA